MDASDALALLRLQAEWGADEALADSPVSRLAAKDAPPPARPASATMSVLSPGTNTGGAGSLAASATSLAELEAALSQPGLSPLASTASHLLFGTGPIGAPAMLVADAPDDADDRAGKPFAGDDGRLLARMLQSAGIDGQTLRIAYLVPWRPPGGRPPTEPELTLGTIFLRRHIELAKPRHVVSLGALTTRALLGRDAARRRAGAQAWRSFHLADGAVAIPFLVMPHPRAVARAGADRRAAWAALRLLQRAISVDLGDTDECNAIVT